MIRAEAVYLVAGFFNDGDAEIRAHQVRMVTTRWTHRCALGDHEIAVGSRARYESAIAEGRPGSCWCCIPCMDRFLDANPEIRDAAELAVRREAAT